MSDILIVDDEKDIRELVSDILQDEGYSTSLAANSDQAFAIIRADAPKFIILDIWLKDSKLDGIDILKQLHKSHPEIPVVIISGHGNIEIAVAAIKQGAYDFVEKPFNMDQLMVVVRRAMETASLRNENATLKQQDMRTAKMVGRSVRFKAMLAQLDKVCTSNSRILLSGGVGVGKELAARYIHNNSQRRKRPFISVNCAAIDAERMEQILFGYGDHSGLLEQANGGVLFFDEVADLPLETQSKIVRVLVGQRFERVDTGDPISVDIRVISASSQNLQAKIKAGEFREELFHRLNVVPIDIPDLSERRDDIPVLCDYFIDELHRRDGLSQRALNAQALAHLQGADWPGNIRQLRNVLERCLILGAHTNEIGLDDVIEHTQTQPTALKAGPSDGVINLPLREAREQFEKDYLLSQIKRFGGNVSKTAHFIGMERSALHRKLKSLNVTGHE